MECCDPVDEEMLVNVCLHRMSDEYRVFLENLTFPSFLKLMEASKHMNEFVRKTPKPSQVVPIVRPMSRKDK